MGKKNTRGKTMMEKLQLSQSVVAHSISQANINPSPTSQPITTLHSVSQATAHATPISQPIGTSHLLDNAGMGKKNTRGQTMMEKLQLSQSVATHSISQPNINPSPTSQPITTLHSVSQATAHATPIFQPIGTSHSLDNIDLSNNRESINKKRG
ncbi:hypothetical protein KSP39_PZI007381 [Platanthera zijinensis]|uniref:Uncharacterized protein n=1 Tax=Platanthera zijinensis TaxID=2320716 RepID=A0AAP0BPV1_9ASPA